MVEKLDFHKFGFEKLEVWQKSVEFAMLIYKLTHVFPKSEVYGLTSQIQRAVISISSKEGFGLPEGWL